MPVPPPDPQGGGGGGGGPPTGAAGGDLAGTYPNPTVGLLKITDGKVAAANKDGLANVPSLRTLGTGAQQALAGNTDVSGTPAPASRYEAGGADPITNLGLVTIVDGVGSVAVTDDPGQVGSPVLTIDGVGASSDRIVLRALGPYIEMYDNTPVILGLYQSSSLVFGADITPGDTTTNVCVLLYDDSGNGHLILSNTADGKQRIDLNASTGMVSLGADLTGVGPTVTITDDGQGAQFLDGNGSVLTQLAGDGVTGLIIADVFTTNRVVIAPDGTGVTLNDASAVLRGRLYEDPGAHGIVLQGYDADGNLVGELVAGGADQFELRGFDALTNFRNDISVYDESMEFSHFTDAGVAGAKSVLFIGAAASGGQETSTELRGVDTDGSTPLYSASFNDPTHGGMQFNIDDAFITIQNAANFGFQVSVGTSSIVADGTNVTFDGTGEGHFGVTPAPQQPLGTTAADALACLIAFGYMAAA